MYLQEVLFSLKALVWRRWVLAMVPVFVWWSIFSGPKVEFNSFFMLEIQGWTFGSMYFVFWSMYLNCFVCSLQDTIAALPCVGEDERVGPQAMAA